jgi:hypothetical protein
MMSTEYRIDFTITRRRDGDEDFTEVGFGSSGAWGSVGAAAYEMESIVQNRMWETSDGMPDPDSLEGSDEVEKER